MHAAPNIPKHIAIVAGNATAAAAVAAAAEAAAAVAAAAEAAAVVAAAIAAAAIANLLMLPSRLAIGPAREYPAM